MRSTTISVFGPLSTLSPYHVLAYGSLLGTELYQSFVMTGICYRALPTSAFTTLQKRVFPIYFRLQTLLAVLTAVTHPPLSVYSLIHRWYEVTPLTICIFTSLLNLGIYGPKTINAMVERIHQETKDKMKFNGLGVKSEDMKLVNKRFSRNHAMSIHLNLIGILATIWYGLALSFRIQT